MTENCGSAPGPACPSADRIVLLEKRLEQVQAWGSKIHQEIFGRLNVLERSKDAQEVTLRNIDEKLDKLVGKLEALEAKPARRWDSLVDRLLFAAVGAAAAWIAAGMPM